MLMKQEEPTLCLTNLAALCCDLGRYDVLDLLLNVFCSCETSDTDRKARAQREDGGTRQCSEASMHEEGHLDTVLTIFCVVYTIRGD